jgi:hypothetical protein
MYFKDITAHSQNLFEFSELNFELFDFKSDGIQDYHWPVRGYSVLCGALVKIKTGNVRITHNITLRRVRVTIFAVKNQ